MEKTFYDMKRVYIAKEDTWFKDASECELIEDYGKGRGLYKGTYIVGPNVNYDTFWHKRGHVEGDEVVMNEVCLHDEFLVLERKLNFKIGDDVIVRDTNQEGVINKLVTFSGYSVVFPNGNTGYFSDNQLIINREKRLSKLLDKKK